MAAIAAIVAVVGATTAAVIPQAPADRPQPMPALTNRALAARYAADSERIAQATSAARRAGNTDLVHALAKMRGHHFLDFNPRGNGLAVQVVGNLATARRVAIIVPGSDTSLTTFGSRGSASPAGAAVALATEAHRLEHGARLAVIAWLGYGAPSTFSPGVLTSGDAIQGSGALRPFVNKLARGGRQIALLCHSYGSVVCGLAAPHLPVSDIAVFGSPGMDASSAHALRSPGRVWAGRGGGDWTRYVPHIHLLGLGFGQDPTASAFGARRFDCGAAGHSGYFRRGTIALRNLAYIALGDPAAVTR
ncbi:MAG: alpha/beta hydrolase family protein [Nocardiopsaceae bacterium]|nr:alpha/beta hydrolase family protein [Nocardiopsaceae bacterium]